MTCAFLLHCGMAGNASLICFADSFGMKKVLAERRCEVTAKEGFGGTFYSHFEAKNIASLRSTRHPSKSARDPKPGLGRCGGRAGRETRHDNAGRSPASLGRIPRANGTSRRRGQRHWL